MSSLSTQLGLILKSYETIAQIPLLFYFIYRWVYYLTTISQFVIEVQPSAPTSATTLQPAVGGGVVYNQQ